MLFPAVNPSAPIIVGDDDDVVVDDVADDDDADDGHAGNLLANIPLAWSGTTNRKPAREDVDLRG